MNKKMQHLGLFGMDNNKHNDQLQNVDVNNNNNNNNSITDKNNNSNKNTIQDTNMVAEKLKRVKQLKAKKNKKNNNSNNNNNNNSNNSNSSNNKLFAEKTKTKKKPNQNQRIVFNVSGQIYETFAMTLEKYPTTMLGDPNRRSELMDAKANGDCQIFINRNQAIFEAILFFYQSSGNLIRPSSVLMSIFEEECRFFDLPEDAIKRMKDRELFLYKPKKTLPPSHTDGTFLYKLWMFLENPKDSGSPCLATCYFYTYYTLVIASIALFCTETEIYLHLSKQSTVEEYQSVHSFIEIALNTFFITELSSRFMASPFPKDFFRQPTNALELLSVFIFVLFYGFPYSVHRRNTMMLSRMLCIFRLTRLGRISKVVDTSFTVFFESIQDVIAVLFTMVIIVVFGGTVMYYMESGVPATKFKSIPDSMWWAIQTSICLGYGDIVPQTIYGRYLGMFVLYGGVIVVMVLILSLGGRVFDMYIKEFDETCAGFLPDINEERDQDYEIHYRDPPMDNVGDDGDKLKRKNSSRVSVKR